MEQETSKNDLKLDYKIRYINNLDDITAKNISYFLDKEGKYLNIFDGKNIYIIKLYTDKLYDILKDFASLKCNKYGNDIIDDLIYMIKLGITEYNNFVFDLEYAYFCLKIGRNEIEEYVDCNYSDREMLEELFNTSFKKFDLKIYLILMYKSYEIFINELNKLDTIEIFEEHIIGFFSRIRDLFLKSEGLK